MKLFDFKALFDSEILSQDKNKAIYQGNGKTLRAGLIAIDSAYINNPDIYNRYKFYLCREYFVFPFNYVEGQTEEEIYEDLRVREKCIIRVYGSSYYEEYFFKLSRL